MSRAALPLCTREDPNYPRLKELLISATGLAHYADRDEEFSDIVGRRLAELGHDGCGAYLEALSKKDGPNPEIEQIAQRLTVGETYFFRHAEQFDALRRCILPDLIERNRAVRRLRIWSAGCANGAEAYSVAIVLKHEFGAALEGWDVAILGTDINRASLDEARIASFAEWHLRGTPDHVRQICFTRSGRVWTLRPEYKEWTRFAYRNLIEVPFQAPLDGVDLILCRNVVIYFGAETKRRLVAEFRGVLAGNGWLVVGPVEPNLDGFEGYRAVNAMGATSYQKAERQPLPPGAEAADNAPCETPAVPVEHSGCKNAASRRELAVLRTLADRGERERVVRYAAELAANDPSNPVVHFYRALALELLGRHAEAEGYLRRAIAVDGRFLLAHYQLGLSCKNQANHRQAAQSFQDVLRLANGMGEERSVAEGDGVSAAELRRMALSELALLGGTGVPA